MNKLINTDSGGYPFVLDDLRFVDDSVREALKGGLSFLGDGFVLSANYNNITAATSWSFPETFAVLNGEILRIPAFTANSSPAVGKWYKLELDSTNSGTTPGLKTFQDASVHETYNLRKGKLTLQTTPLVGGEVVILSGNSWFTAWTYNVENTHKKRLADNIGLTTTTTTANSAQSDATDALDELITINEAWSEMNIADLVGNVLRNNLADGSGTNASMTFNSGASYFRMKTIGKTVFIQYLIQSINVVEWDTAQINSITLDLIAADFLQAPTTIKSFSAIGEARSSSGVPTAHLKVSNHTTKAGALLFNLIDPNYKPQNLPFNRKATFDVSTIRFVLTNEYDFPSVITLTGTLIIELS